MYHAMDPVGNLGPLRPTVAIVNSFLQFCQALLSIYIKFETYGSNLDRWFWSVMVTFLPSPSARRSMSSLSKFHFFFTYKLL